MSPVYFGLNAMSAICLKDFVLLIKYIYLTFERYDVWKSMALMVQPVLALPSP
jgi:hypothetical protein